MASRNIIVWYAGSPVRALRYHTYVYHATAVPLVGAVRAAYVNVKCCVH